MKLIICHCIDEFEKGGVDIVVTVTDAHRSPYFNMVTINQDGYSSLVIPPTDRILRRQDAPDVFDMTTVAYVASQQFVHAHDSPFGVGYVVYTSHGNEL